MDYAQIQAAKVAGTATIAVMKEEIMRPIPLAPNDERITVTLKRFATYTGEEIEPEVQTHRKSDLLREIASIDQQIANLEARKTAINALLVEFSAPVAPVVVIK